MYPDRDGLIGEVLSRGTPFRLPRPLALLANLLTSTVTIISFILALTLFAFVGFITPIVGVAILAKLFG